ncbi:MAG: class I SAM-dependent methyltransferase [Rhodobacteraceae bacterium]|nr:class I SAM-dependent methyltransferase [Paracoccaceae bacterium]
MSDEKTIAVYDAQAEEYSRRTQALFELPQLNAFAAALPQGGRVLDLGCGPGFYAAALAKQGFLVDALDASSEMVALACKQPGVTARQAGFDDVTEAALYDGIWANFSLLHTPRNEFPGHLARLKRAGKPGVVLHLGMKLGRDEGTDRLGRFYTYYSEEELENQLRDAGFAISERLHGEDQGMAGNIEPWLTVLARG